MLPVAGAGQAPKPAPPAPPPASATRAGSAAYYVPPRMVEGVSTNVDLWIDRAVPLATLQKELAARLQMTADRIRSRIVRDSGKATGAAPVISEVEGATIPIGDTMIAHLKGGADFDIDPKDPVTQSLVGEERAKWAWRVTPKRAAAVLQLDLDIWIDPGAGKRLIDSYHEVVQVSARERTWIEVIEGINKILALFGIGGIGAVALAVWKLPKWLRERKANNTAAGRIIVGQG